MNKIAIAFAAAAIALGTAAHAHVSSFEEQAARAEEKQIIAAPIGGMENRFWFNYQADLLEARKELRHDLRHSSDSEDIRDAWDEYRVELGSARRTYVKQMRKRGYRFGTVSVG